MPPRRRTGSRDLFVLQVGLRLRAVRVFRGIAQPAVEAVASKYIGRTAYARYETGTREMGHEIVARLCRGFCITVDLLTWGDAGADMWARDPLLCDHLVRHYPLIFQDARAQPTVPPNSIRSVQATPLATFQATVPPTVES